MMMMAVQHPVEDSETISSSLDAGFQEDLLPNPSLPLPQSRAPGF
jgi:hypothetical protein